MEQRAVNSTNRRTNPAWIVTAAITIGALVVGAVGESVLAPSISQSVSQAEARVASAAAVLLSKPTTTVAHAASPSAPSPAATSTTAATPAASVPAAVTAPSTTTSTGPYVSVVEKAGPAVVTVVNQMPAQVTAFGQVAHPEALGSGVIIDNQGHIVTNNHVVAGGGNFQVIFSNGKKVPATLVGHDSISDIAVLKVNVPVPAVATFGNSNDVQPGQRVVAIGSALGDFRNTVTHGIISGLDRTLPAQNGEALSGMIQTDAPINHGNSGGPLLNLQGQVIGINTAVVRGSGVGGDVAEGLGFAIPSDTVKQIADQLIAHGIVPRPFLGVSAAMISPQIASYYGLSVNHGALIQAVQPGSPAEKAGLRPEDVITAIDGTQINDTNTLESVLLKHKIGDSVTLTVVRNQQTLTLTAVLGQRPASS